MLEYASMRLMLFCSTPTTVPTIIVAAEITPSSGTHSLCSGWNVDRNTRTNAANAAALTPVDMKAVTIVGAPSYASGVHMWNGTAETLKQKPTARSPTAMMARTGGAEPAITLPIASSCVDLASRNDSAIPYRKNALENAPSRKYLNAASAPAALSWCITVRTYTESDSTSSARNTTSRSVAAAISIIPLIA